MKRIFAMIFKSLIIVLSIFAGIQIELRFPSGYGAALSLLYTLCVPMILCDIMSKKKDKRGTVAWGGSIWGIMFVLGYIVLKFVVLGILNLIFDISDYVAYCIALYLFVGFTWLMFYGDETEDRKKKAIEANQNGEEYKDDGLAQTGSKTWMFILIIHLAARYLFVKYPVLGNWNYLAVAVLCIYPIVTGPIRGDISIYKEEKIMKDNHLSSKCPVCQNKFTLPIYICPSCGRKHEGLMPDEDGTEIICPCSYVLPTTIYEKSKLEAHCPFCGADVKDGGNHMDISIPVVGGASSGKTCFIHQAIDEIANTMSHLNYEPSIDDYDSFADNINAMKKGRLPEKTSDLRLNYYQFYLTQKYGVKNLISLCDVAGETYGDQTAIGDQIGFKYADAFIMVIDPLSVEMYRNELERSGVDISKYGCSQDNADAVFGNLITTLENIFCMNSKEMLKTDVAMVFTKGDVPGLSKKIGDEAVDEYLKHHSVSRVEAQNALCESFLLEYGESNLLNTIRSKFKSYQFFTVSALGHASDGTPFVAKNVADPVLWLVNKASLSIDISDRWKK